MPIDDHLTEFAGKPVADWDPDVAIADPKGTVYRISIDYDESEEGLRWTDKFEQFLADPAAQRVTGLVVGAWGEVWDNDSVPVVEALVAARDRLPALRSLFLGDIIGEETEISWIHQSDLSPLFAAYPALEQFGVRGVDGLSLGGLCHERLKTLIVQSGGLPVQIVREVTAAELPALERLELWLGAASYGADTTVEDLAPILAGDRFPKLTHLGLQDSELADEIAAAVARAPVLERLRVLDLSLGTLTDEGAAALLASPALARLEKLDIHHHYCSEAMVAKLEGLGITVDTSDPQEPEEGYGERSLYVAVSE
jgi:hypothetical protein